MMECENVLEINEWCITHIMLKNIFIFGIECIPKEQNP
jgi:hypothetical protein